MAHKNRAARRANELRRERAAHAQRPVPLELQAEIAAANRAARLSRYPVPPLYRLSYARPKPVQPKCYPSRY